MKKILSVRKVLPDSSHRGQILQAQAVLLSRGGRERTYGGILLVPYFSDQWGKRDVHRS